MSTLSAEILRDGKIYEGFFGIVNCDRRGFFPLIPDFHRVIKRTFYISDKLRPARSQYSVENIPIRKTARLELCADSFKIRFSAVGNHRKTVCDNARIFQIRRRQPEILREEIPPPARRANRGEKQKKNREKQTHNARNAYRRLPCSSTSFAIFSCSAVLGEVVTIYTPANTKNDAKSLPHENVSCPTITAIADDTTGWT